METLKTKQKNEVLFKTDFSIYVIFNESYITKGAYNIHRLPRVHLHVTSRDRSTVEIVSFEFTKSAPTIITSPPQGALPQ